MKRLNEQIENQIKLNDKQIIEETALGNFNKCAELSFKNVALIEVQLMILELEQEVGNV